VEIVGGSKSIEAAGRPDLGSLGRMLSGGSRQDP
jgi:hypothetical protein